MTRMKSFHESICQCRGGTEWAGPTPYRDVRRGLDQQLLSRPTCMNAPVRPSRYMIEVVGYALPLCIFDGVTGQ